MTNNVMTQIPDAGASVRRGTDCLARGDAQSAFKAFSQALLADPSHVPAYKGRAEARMMMSDFEHAIGDINRVIKSGADAEMYFLRGCARQELGDVGGAFGDLSTAVKIKPDFAEAYAVRAGVQRMIGNLAAADEDERRAAQLTPQAA